MTLKMSQSTEDDIFVTSCSYCERKFSQHKALYVHMRNFHKDKPINYKQKSKIICSLCSEEQKQIKIYWEHIQSKHPEVKLSFEKKFFYSEEDFSKWRTEMETKTHAHFLASRSQTKLKDGRIVQRFQCDRSGVYKPSGTCTRKFSGSKKIGKFCPAYIYRSKTIVDDLIEIEVDFQSVHMGHKFDVHSLRIRSEQRERRLRAKGKSRWTKDFPFHEEANDVQIVDLHENSQSPVVELSDVLLQEPNLEIEHISCNCDDYTVLATCEHVQKILDTINKIRSVPNEDINFESSGVKNSACVDTDASIVLVKDLGDSVENGSIKTLENEKTLILEEFHQLVNTCQNWEHLEILKNIVVEGKKHLSSKSVHETQCAENSHSFENIDNVHLTPSLPYSLLNDISTTSLNTSILSLLSCQDKLMILREDLNYLQLQS